jgi:hypothetical protein
LILRWVLRASDAQHDNSSCRASALSCEQLRSNLRPFGHFELVWAETMQECFKAPACRVVSGHSAPSPRMPQRLPPSGTGLAPASDRFFHIADIAKLVEDAEAAPANEGA